MIDKSCVGGRLEKNVNNTKQGHHLCMRRTNTDLGSISWAPTLPCRGIKFPCQHCMALGNVYECLKFPISGDSWRKFVPYWSLDHCCTYCEYHNFLRYKKQWALFRTLYLVSAPTIRSPTTMCVTECSTPQLSSELYINTFSVVYNTCCCIE